MSIVVPKDQVFEKYELINRKPFSDYLSSYLNSKADQGYVINLNAEWGAGKTTFLQCWYNELSKNHPTIYFDAWRSDFSKDAMLALIDCFHAQLASPIADNKELIKSLLTKGSYFIRKSLPSLVVGYLKHQSGAPEDESWFEDVQSQFGLDIEESEMGNALKDVLKEIVEQRQKVEGIEEFQKVLVELAQAVKDTSEHTPEPKNYPVYVLIDELDRCRPSYAIEVIESIKHFFNTDNFVFVIATDTEQLQHSVKAVYGQGFDAYSYLSRFFHKTVTLPAPSMAEYLVTRLLPITSSEFNFEDKFILEFLVKIFEWHNMISLREIDKVIQDIEVAKITENKRFKFLPLVLLSVLKRLHPVHFNAYQKSKLQPYRSRHSSGQNQSYLPTNININKININSEGGVNFENALCSILGSIGKHSENNNLEEIENLPSHNLHAAIEIICNAYVINKSKPLAAEEDYMNVLNLAGHF